MIEEVGALLRETAAGVVLPAFGHLNPGEVEEKAPGEVVTVADRQAERKLAEGLRRILPGSEVVGEEGVAADPSELDLLRDPGPVWLVDPVDGTANFAAGRRPFAMMVALLRGGATEASWILDPVDDSLAVAVAGEGAYLDGVRVRARREEPAPGRLRGAMPIRFLPPDLRASVEGRWEGLGELLPGQHCAGREYPDVVVDRQHFAFFWRTLPWDHAPGVLLVREAGGVARRLNGDPYDPADDQRGLLVAANERIWETVRESLG
ncbi:inositol monophosphatase family protein [Micromonospora sp. NPDC049559]|uniref:inositol monophosphatase family protein n=1 Tax=Micromonospora sp. NPDC049559 TaxID=3155923 RepID=UPI0034361719